jgi:hypothetical protein
MFEGNVVSSTSESRNKRRMFLYSELLYSWRLRHSFSKCQEQPPQWYSATSQKTWIFNNMAMNTSNLWTKYSSSSSQSFKFDLARYLYASVLCLYTLCYIRLTWLRSHEFWLTSGQEIFPASDHPYHLWGLLFDSTTLNGLVAWSWPDPYGSEVKNMWRFTSASLHAIMAWCFFKHRDNLPFPSLAVYANLDYLDTCYLYF